MQTEDVRSRLLQMEEAIKRIYEIIERLHENDQIILEILKRQEEE